MESKPKSRILNKQTDFNNLRKFGKKLSPKSWLVVNYAPNEVGYLRYGFTISSKVGTAVVRNRLKRWLRESVRSSLKSGFDSNIDLNIFLKPIGNEFYAKLQYNEVKTAMDLFVKRIK